MGAVPSTTPQPINPKNDREKARAPPECSAERTAGLVALLESHHGHVPCPPPTSTTPWGCFPYLRVLRGDLQDERQAVVVEVFVEGQQRPVHPALNEVVRVLAKPDGLDPVDDLVVGPHQHVCKRARPCPRAAQTVLVVVWGPDDVLDPCPTAPG